MRAMRRVAVLIGVGLATMLSAGGVARAADLGPNVKVIDPSMPTAQIQATFDQVAAQQVPNQFGTQRVRDPLQAGHLRQRGAAAQRAGRLLHGGRRARRLAARRDDQRDDRRLQPVRRLAAASR